MKKILLFACLCSLSVGTYAQTDSLTLSQRIALLEENQLDAERQLKAFHSEYVTGNIVALGGLLITTGGVMMEMNKKEGYRYKKDANNAVPVLVAGGIITISGVVLTMLAHNRIKTARMRLMGNGVSIGLKKEK